MTHGIGDTIAAVATPPGEGGIAVLRVSGPDAEAVASRVFRGRGGRPLAESPPFRLTLGTVFDPSSGDSIDEVLAVRMPAGRSYTGESTVEIQAHGGPAVVDAVLRCILAAGARIAEPGEFTKRAFLNGRMDLTQAEAVADLIRADSEDSRRAALRQLQGGLGREIGVLRDRLFGLVAEVEALIDFAEDEGLAIELPAEGILKLESEIRDLVRRGLESRAVRYGATVTIAGRPNTGKSSIFNKLSNSERSIVTPIAGTTRDYVEERAYLGGATVTLIDTAGIREPRDEPEAEGIRRSLARIHDAAVLVLVIDGSSPLSDDDAALVADLRDRKPLLVVSKSDLAVTLDWDRLRRSAPDLEILSVSSVSGDGIDRLRKSLTTRVHDALKRTRATDASPNQRHREALLRAAASLGTARGLAASPTGIVDQIATELRSALSAVCEITGETAGEDVIGSIFSRFCVGK